MEQLLNPKYSNFNTDFIFDTTDDNFNLFKQYYDKHFADVWSENEITMAKDQEQFENMSENEKEFVKNILAFFSFADGVVNHNIDFNFLKEITPAVAKRYYALQEVMEYVHQATYDKLLVNFVSDKEELENLRHALTTMPTIAKKGEWALKYINSNNSFVEKLVAMIMVEGIFFSGSFASIEYLKTERKLLVNSLGKANELIMRDELLHTAVGINVYKSYIQEKLSDNYIIDMALEAVNIEKEFIENGLGSDLVGLKKEDLKLHIEFIADSILEHLIGRKYFNTKNPLNFMQGDKYALTGIVNFFEADNSSYRQGYKLNNNDFEQIMDI